MADLPAAPDAPLSWPARLAALAGFVLLAWLIVHAARYVAPPPPAEVVERSELALDLEAPDALIESASLSALPKDLLRIPLLKDTLTEDFVFYYRSNADRLGLAGSLRRIAYEHDLPLRDTLLQELLDQPAQIALWRGRDGKLGHALLRLQRGALAKTLQPLAQIAADDKQVSRVGAIDVGGSAVDVFRLRYNADRAVLFAAHGDELIVLTSPGMLQASEADGATLARSESTQLARLLAGTLRYAPRFGLRERAATHRIALDADYLALGYGRFIPQLAGVRLEMDDAGWHSYLALDGGASFEFAPLWQAMPMGPAACSAAPVSAQALRPVFDKLALPPALASQLAGPVALCWYAHSRLHTPLLVTRLAGDNAQVDAQLGEVFDRMVGSSEQHREAGRFSVERSEIANGVRWQRIVGSDFGGHAPDESVSADELQSSHYFRVTLLRHGDLLAFSLDDVLAEKALATLEKRFPPLAEQLPKNAQVPAYVAPGALAKLLEQETLDSLPADAEAVFRNAAERHLLPKLRAMDSHPAWAVTLPATLPASGRWQWVPMEWSAL